jgi:predicted HAD superfamily Cof-like phosphohydrolase
MTITSPHRYRRDQVATTDDDQLAFDLGQVCAHPPTPRAGGRRGLRGVVATLERRPANPQLLVEQFHLAFGLPGQTAPGVDAVDDLLATLRVDLLVEEVAEFRDASCDRNLVKIADAIGDILYVTYGAAVTYGIDADAVLREVHRSNMSKLGEDGRPILRDDGKVLKSSRYTPPDVLAVLARQGYRSPTGPAE